MDWTAIIITFLGSSALSTASYNGNSFPQITFAVNSNGEIVSYNTADLAALIN